MSKTRSIDLDAPRPELALGPDVAFPIVLKAREYEAKVPQTDPNSGSDPVDDKNVDVLETEPSDPTYAELAQAIHGLNDDEQLDLIALIWLGRGDYGLAEWAEARAGTADIGRARLPRYVASLPLASEYLEEGLSQFGHAIGEYLDDH
jgi:hypothetical protein